MFNLTENEISEVSGGSALTEGLIGGAAVAAGAIGIAFFGPEIAGAAVLDWAFFGNSAMVGLSAVDGVMGGGDLAGSLLKRN